MRTEGLHVDFSQNVNFSPCAWNCIFWGFEVSGTQFWLWEFVQITYWGSISRFFKKVSIFFPDLVIANFWGLRYQELNYVQDNSSGLTIESLHVDCAKDVNAILWSYNGIIGLFRHHKLFHVIEKCPRVTIEGTHVNLLENFIVWELNCTAKIFRE